MLPIKTGKSDHEFKAPQGREDEIGNMPCQIVTDDGFQVVRSIWKPSQDERLAIASGANIELDIAWIGVFPPIAMNTTEEGAL